MVLAHGRRCRSCPRPKPPRRGSRRPQALEALNKLENDLMKGSIEHQVHDTLVSEDHAVLLMRLMARRPGRGALDAQVVYVYHVHDERLAELRSPAGRLGEHHRAVDFG